MAKDRELAAPTPREGPRCALKGSSRPVAVDHVQRHDAPVNAPPIDPTEFAADGLSRWAGMGDHRLISFGGSHQIDLSYMGEPPFGDSYHEVYVNSVKLPGFMWGCMFAFTPDGRFLAGSWMQQLYERRTIVIDGSNHCYSVLPVYIYDFAFRWPLLEGVNGADGLSYAFNGRERWTTFESE